MLRGDASGRVPFALVAVLLLLSAGLSAMYAAKLSREEAEARAQEARVAALAQVAEEVHREALSQAQLVGLDAIGKGMQGILNETRVSAAFRSGFAEYIASHFPRVVRGVAVSVADYEAGIGLAQRRVEDLQPSNVTRVESIDGTTVATPDSTAPDVLAPVDRLAYFDVHGFVNYTLSMEGVTLRKLGALTSLVPLPAPLMESKLEQAARAGEGDLAGIGHTVKAILASLVQFRVLNGFASPMRPGTTTRDVLTSDDVELAVNLALLLEEARLFRAFDRDAAAAVDAAHPPPVVPEGLLPPTAERTLVHLLDRYAAEGTLDATDLYALYTGLDAQGLSLGSVFAQAIAAIADELVLKPLDYLGLTPLADWLADAALQTAGAVDDFLRWLTGTPSRQATYVFQYVEAVFLDTRAGTRFFGPLEFALPARTYDVPNGSATIRVPVPAHMVTILFPAEELTLEGYDRFWSCYYSTLNSSVSRLGGTLRGLVNDVAARIAEVAIWSGLLPTSATGALDPKDDASFLDVLGARVETAVDDALAWFRSNPYAVDALMANLWNETKGMLQDLVDYMIAGYDVSGCAPALVDRQPEVLRAYNAIADDLFTRGALAVALNASQRDALRSAVNADVTRNAWDAAAFTEREGKDIDNWRLALELADGATLPGARLRAQLGEEVGGATGWLALAAASVKGLVAEARQAQDLAALRAIYTLTTRPFVLQDAWRNGSRLTEEFRVRHSPGYLRRTAGLPGAPTKEGDLRIEVVDPASLAPADGTPNVHYTKPTERSRRPFTTGWTVGVSGAVHLQVETALPVLVGTGGLEPARLERTWPLNFSISFAAYSGWNLTGVRYRASDSLFSDILAFLDQALLETVRIVRWVLEVVRVVFEIVWKLMERLADYASKIVRLLGEALSHLLDILRMMAMQVLSFVGPFLDALRAAFPSERRFDLHVAGILVHVVVSGDLGRSLVLDVSSPARTRIEFVRLAESEYRSAAPPNAIYDVLTRWDGSVGALHQAASFDPLNVSQPKMIEGSAWWAGAWRANYSGPDVESAYLIDRSVALWIPLEGVELEIAFGVEALLVLPPTIDVEGMIVRSVHEALEAVQPIRTWSDVGLAVRTIGKQIEEQVLDAIEATIVEVSLYVQVDVKAVAAGGGERLALVADGTAVRTVVEWVIDNVAAYFENGMDPFAWARYAALPQAMLEHTSVRAEVHFIAGAPSFLKALGIEGEIRLAARVEPNLAAVGRFLGANWGSPAIEFGLLVDGRFQLLWLPGAYAVVYILRGTAIPL